MIFFFESPGSLKFHGGIGPKAAGHKLHQLSYMEGIHGIHSFYLQGRHKENSSGNGLCTASVNIAGVNSKKKNAFCKPFSWHKWKRRKTENHLPQQPGDLHKGSVLVPTTLS